MISLLYCFHIAVRVFPHGSQSGIIYPAESVTLFNYCDNTAMQLQKTDKNQRGIESESD